MGLSPCLLIDGRRLELAEPRKLRRKRGPVNCRGSAGRGPRLGRAAWGQGYATETLRAMVALAVMLGVVRLEALCHPEHEVSSHVLEKCGFLREAKLARHTVFPNLTPDVPLDVLLYARILDESVQAR